MTLNFRVRRRVPFRVSCLVFGKYVYGRYWRSLDSCIFLSVAFGRSTDRANSLGLYELNLMKPWRSTDRANSLGLLVLYVMKLWRSTDRTIGLGHFKVFTKEGYFNKQQRSVCLWLNVGTCGEYTSEIDMASANKRWVVYTSDHPYRIP